MHRALWLPALIILLAASCSLYFLPRSSTENKPATNSQTPLSVQVQSQTLLALSEPITEGKEATPPYQPNDVTKAPEEILPNTETILQRVAKDEAEFFDYPEYMGCIEYMGRKPEKILESRKSYFLNETESDWEHIEKTLTELRTQIDTCHDKFSDESEQSLLRKYHRRTASLAEQGNSEAQLTYSISLLTSWQDMDRPKDDNAEKRLAEAWLWAELAAANDNPNGMLVLAFMYLAPDSGNYDYEKAMQLIKDAERIFGEELPEAFIVELQNTSIWSSF